MRRFERVARAALGAGLVACALVGCGASSSANDAGRLDDGIDELVSVGGPDGQAASLVEVLGCGDDAEMPMGHARFDHEGPSDTDVDAVDADLEELSEWYGERWTELGWEVDPVAGSATKTFDGEVLRAGVDADTSTSYSVYVVRDGAGLCS